MLLVIGCAFKSVLVPLRAVFCLIWMLFVTFGLAVLVYQVRIYRYRCIYI